MDLPLPPAPVLERCISLGAPYALATILIQAATSASGWAATLTLTWRVPPEEGGADTVILDGLPTAAAAMAAGRVTAEALIGAYATDSARPLGQNYAPNRRLWQVGDLVIHDGDDKKRDMLMRVIGFAPGGQIRTRYVTPAAMNHYSRRVYRNSPDMLHDPARWSLTSPPAPNA